MVSKVTIFLRHRNVFGYHESAYSANREPTENTHNTHDTHRHGCGFYVPSRIGWIPAAKNSRPRARPTYVRCVFATTQAMKSKWFMTMRAKLTLDARLFSVGFCSEFSPCFSTQPTS